MECSSLPPVVAKWILVSPRWPGQVSVMKSLHFRIIEMNRSEFFKCGLALAIALQLHRVGLFGLTQKPNGQLFMKEGTSETTPVSIRPVPLFMGFFKSLEYECSNEAETLVCSAIMDFRFGVPLICRNLSSFT